MARRPAQVMAALLVGAASLAGCAGNSPSREPGSGPPSSSGTAGPSQSASSAPVRSTTPPRPTTTPVTSPAPSSHPTTQPTTQPTTHPISPPTTHPNTHPNTPPAPPVALLGREWDRIPTTRRVVALTFDAGANAAGLAAIVSTLDQQDAAATFFLTSSWIDEYPDQARATCARFRVGDHSRTHPHFTELSDSEIRAEVLGAAADIRRSCGADPWPLFRFPFGDRDTRTIAAVNRAGYVPVGWTVDTLGWQGTSSGRSTASVIDRVLAGLEPGEIVLMHVGSNPKDHTTLDADALPTIISRVRARGYAFVSLDALLR